MTAVAFDADATDFGTDVYLQDDLPPVWGLAREDVNYALAQLRRLSQRSGAMDFYDPTYICLDLRGYLSAKMGQADVSRLQGRINRAMQSDPRTNRCTSKATFDPNFNTLRVSLDLETAEGPFTLVLQANSVTVGILAINGVQTPQLAAAAAAAPVTTVVVSGGGGGQGPPGPPGTSNPSRSFGLQDVEDSSGAEVAQLQTQFEIDWSTLGSPISVEVIGMGSDDGAGVPGPGIFRLRINGSDGAADGTVVATVNAPNAAATRVSGGSSFANPGGHGRVILTVQSSAGTKLATLRGATVVFQS